MRWMMGLLIAAAFAAGYGIGAFPGGEEAVTRGRSDSEQHVAKRPPGLSSGGIAAADMADVLARLEFEEASSRNGWFDGRVLDNQGAPIAGVVVVATPGLPRNGRRHALSEGRPKRTPMDEVVTRYAVRMIAQRRGTAEATTGADGRYKISGLGADRYRVTTHKARYAFASSMSRGMWNLPPNQTIDWVGKRVVRVEIDVLLPNGTRPNQALIMVWTIHKSGGRLGSGAAWSPADAWIEVEPGDHRIQASVTGNTIGKSEEFLLEVPDDAPASPLTLHINVKPSLTVAIIPPAGFHPTKWRPALARFQGDHPPSAETLQRSDLNYRSESVRFGTYRWSSLEPGRYVVAICRGHRGPIMASEIVVLENGATVASLTIPEPDPEKFARVRPLSPDGTPLRGLRWSSVFHGKNRRSSASTEVMERTDGVTFVAITERHEGLEGEHSVRATHEDFGTASAIVGAASGISATGIPTLQFREPAFVTVQVIDYRGSGCEGRLGVRCSESSRRGHSHSIRVDANGKSKFGPFQPGEIEFALTIEGFDPRVLSRKKVVVEAGKQEVSLSIPALHEVKVVWSGKGRPRVNLRRTSRNRRGRPERISARVGENGEIVIRDLVEGQYEVSMSGTSDRNTRTISVPETSEIRLP